MRPQQPNGGRGGYGPRMGDGGGFERRGVEGRGRFGPRGGARGGFEQRGRGNRGGYGPRGGNREGFGRGAFNERPMTAYDEERAEKDRQVRRRALGGLYMIC